MKSILKRMVRLSARVQAFQDLAIYCYEIMSARSHGWQRRHPFDLANGVSTSGVLPGYLIKPTDPFDAPTTSYGAAQPSIVRTALNQIPRQHYRFLDIGCGKGRPALIATEFDFLAVVGIEMSPALARIARRNADVFAHAHPDRPRIRVVTGDALTHDLDQTNVVFLYNSLGQALTQRLVINIEQSLAISPRDFYIISYNPVWAEVFDGSACLERRYAAQVPYSAGEIGYGPDASDAVVIWQNLGNPHPVPAENPHSKIVITVPLMRAEVGLP
jgi:SAM-dependent methyltransferase